MNCVPRRPLALVFVEDLIHRARHRAQVGSVYVGIDVEHGLDIVVADDAQFGARLDGGQVAEHLDGARHAGGGARRSGHSGGAARGELGCGRAGYGQAAQRRQAVEPVLRGLRGDVVADPVARVEIEIGRGLEASAERDQNALSDILLREPDGGCARAVHVHRHAGVVERLLDAGIDGAGNVAHVVEHALGQGAVCVEIGAHDLDVDGRRQAEVQDLRDDVHRQRIKRHAGVFAGQHLAQHFDIVRRGVVLRRELHLDVRVGRTDGRRCRIGKVQAGIGQPDVIDDADDLAGGNVLADGGVDVVAQGRGFFNARAGARAQVNLELAGIDGGKEILARDRGPGRPRIRRPPRGRR